MSKIKKAVSKEVIQQTIIENHKSTFPSRFKFLQAHNGVRSGMLQVLLGVSGAGKSSLFKTMIVDSAANEKVLVWLSEESVVEYQVAMCGVPGAYNNLKNVYFVEEKELDEWVVKDHKVFIQYFKDTIIESGCTAVFVDNVTTSMIYSDDIGVEQQSKNAMALSKITKELGVAIVCVTHTKKHVTDNQAMVMTKEDVRGSNKIVMLSEYLWIMQRFISGNVIYPIIIIDKHRHHAIKDKYYLLEWVEGCYQHDAKIKFELVTKIFKSRNRLG